MKKIQRKAKQENEKNCDKNDKGESDMKQENIGSDHSEFFVTNQKIRISNFFFFTINLNFQPNF